MILCATFEVVNSNFEFSPFHFNILSKSFRGPEEFQNFSDPPSRISTDSHHHRSLTSSSATSTNVAHIRNNNDNKNIRNELERGSSNTLLTHQVAIRVFDHHFYVLSFCGVIVNMRCVIDFSMCRLFKHQWMFEWVKIMVGNSIFYLQNTSDDTSKWSCLVCTYLNWPKTRRCVQCYHQRSTGLLLESQIK